MQFNKRSIETFRINTQEINNNHLITLTKIL